MILVQRYQSPYITVSFVPLLILLHIKRIANFTLNVIDAGSLELGIDVLLMLCGLIALPINAFLALTVFGVVNLESLQEQEYNQALPMFLLKINYQLEQTNRKESKSLFRKSRSRQSLSSVCNNQCLKKNDCLALKITKNLTPDKLRMENNTVISALSHLTDKKIYS